MYRIVRYTTDIFLFLLVAFALVACGSEEIGSVGNNTNGNGNASLVQNGSVKYVSDDPVDISAVAQRLEMPALRGGESNLVVVHTTDFYQRPDAVNYVMEYDQNKRAGRWTAYRMHKYMSSNLTPEETRSGYVWDRNKWRNGVTWNGIYWDYDPFQEDPLIPRQYRTTLADHSRNNHDRGHVLGSADRLNSMEANGQTFYLSNMHPQLSGFNQRGIWYNLENRIRGRYDNDSFRDTLYVVKGGTIDADYHYTMGNSGRQLIVPDYFFMALLCKNSDPSQWGYKAIAFWMLHEPNNSTDFKAYAVSIDELEQKTGIDFFCNLPDNIETAVESNMIPAAWGL